MRHIENQFAGVFRYSKGLYLNREIGVRGPRMMVLPATELDPSISSSELGKLIEEALASYYEEDQAIPASQWEGLNRQLLETFGASSVSAFERRKREVTIRRCCSTSEVVLFYGEDEVEDLGRCSGAELGSTVLRVLGL